MNKQTLPIDEFLAAIPHGVLIDVRTPAEYAAGHLDGAYNLPLFSDEERAEVGTLYVQTSKEVAVERGLERVGPKMAQFVRIARRLSNNRPLLLYCWRGGMRSNSMAWLFRTAGMQAQVLTGGYKAYRHGLGEWINAHPWQVIVIGGHTGCGKTDVLKELHLLGEQVIDLEALAANRGSAFGYLGQPPQPTTEEFGNRIHTLIRTFTPDRPIWCEGESMSIGRVFIPNEFFDLMTKGIYVCFDIPFDKRIKRLAREYGTYPKERLKEAFLKIQKRLGGDATTRALLCLDEGDVETAAAYALTYYDKGYSIPKNDRNNNSPIHLTMDKDCPAEAAVSLIQLLSTHRITPEI